MTTTVPAEAPPPAPPRKGGPPTVHQLGPFTPERPKAAWGNRLLATLLDSAVVASVTFLATGDAPSLAVVPLLGDGFEADGVAWAAWAAGTMVVLALLQAYTGMTPGKRVTGICVVDDGSGRPIGLLGTVVRWLAHFLDALLCVGYLRAAVQVEGRTFADSLLGTIVVRTRTPEPHPWVAAARRARDAHAPRLRWSHAATRALALVLCAGSAAMSLAHGSSGSVWMADTEAPCSVAGQAPYWASVGGSHTERTQTRLGIERTERESWRAVVGWALDNAVKGATSPPDASATIAVRSPDGLQYTSAQDNGQSGGQDDGQDDGQGFDQGEDGPWWSSTDPVASATVVAPQDIAGWTATATLLDADGEILAECTATVPRVDSEPA